MGVDRVEAFRRAHPMMVRLRNGRVLVTGGARLEHSGCLAVSELYHPRSGRWTRTGSMHTARCWAQAVVLHDGRVLVAGGWAGDRLGSTEIYNPATGTWSKTGRLNVPRETAALVSLPHGRALIAGGVGGRLLPRDLPSAEIYRPRAHRWIMADQMATPHGGEFQNLTSARLRDGDILIAGGSSPTADAERYDVATGTWQPAGRLEPGTRNSLVRSAERSRPGHRWIRQPWYLGTRQ